MSKPRKTMEYHSSDDSDYTSQTSPIESSFSNSFSSTITNNTDYLSMLGSVETCVSEYMVHEPTVNNQIHYQTVGNQAAADLLAQVHAIRDYDLSKPNNNWSMGNWKYFYEDRGVTVFHPRIKGQTGFCKLASVGIIEENINFVWDIIRNPISRYQYDSMLKNMHVVEHVNNMTRVIHMLMETKNCIFKQARDFCTVISERVEKDDVYVLAGRSIEHTSCPITTEVRRSKALASGFVVEPFNRSSKKTKVTYLLQVEVPNLPEAVVKIVMKKQPMAIARLRDLICH